MEGEAQAPSQTYRQNLAQEVKDLRSGGKPQEAASLLNREKNTHLYTLSLALKRQRSVLPLLDQGKFDEQELLQGETRYSGVSNEPSLFETFPYIKGVRGAGLGVGFDQMLDMAVHSQLDEVYIVDYEKASALRTRAMLEIGRRHKDLFGEHPTANQFLDYFTEDHLPTTLEMIQGGFSPQEREILSTAFSRRMSLDPENIKNETDPNAPLEVLHYLQYKHGQQDYDSWVSSDANLHKVFQMYEDGKIQVVLGDLAGIKTMRDIAASLTARQIPLSLVYLSNAIFHMDRLDKIDPFFANMEFMPVNDDTITIQTEPVFAGTDNIPFPESTTRDPYIKANMLPWRYIMQTMEDKRKAENGEYTYNFPNHGVAAVKDIGERKLLTLPYYGASYESVGLREPKQGLILAGIK